MNRMRKVAILSWGAVLASCATMGKTNSLKVGMSKADVVSVMGSPKSTEASDSVEVLNYSLTDVFLGKHQPYYVRLNNDKVSDFGKVAGFRGGQCPRTDMEKPEKSKAK